MSEGYWSVGLSTAAGRFWSTELNLGDRLLRVLSYHTYNSSSSRGVIQTRKYISSIMKKKEIQWELFLLERKETHRELHFVWYGWYTAVLRILRTAYLMSASSQPSGRIRQASGFIVIARAGGGLKAARRISTQSRNPTRGSSIYLHDQPGYIRFGVWVWCLYCCWLNCSLRPEYERRVV